MSRDREAEIRAEQLIEHAGFVRAIARAILARDDLADDAVQDAFTAALAQEPREKGRLRSWLGGIVRHKALEIRRRESRRAERERAAVPSETSVEPTVLAQRADMGRCVIAHVLELPEPYRHVLLLRYHSGLPIRSVAALLDVPIETVRTRQRRALDRLRAALDAHGEGGRAWRPQLVPLAAAGPDIGSSSLTSVLGGPLVAKKVAVVAGVLLVLGGIVWWAGRALDNPPAVESAQLDPEEQAQAGVPALRTNEPQPAAASAETPPAEDTSQHSTDGSRRIHFTGTVLDAKGKPVGGASVRFRTTTRVYPAGTTASDGGFRIVGERMPPRYRSPGLILVTTKDGRVATKNQGAYESMPEELAVGALLLQVGVSLKVRVRASVGTGLPAEVLVLNHGLTGGQLVARAVTNDRGLCTIPMLPRGAYHLIAHGEGCGRGVADTAVPRERGDTVVVDLPPERQVAVEVVDKDSKTPISGAVLDLWEQVRGPGWRATRPYLPRVQLPPTDELGRTRIRRLGDAEHLLLLVQAAGYPAPRAADGFPGSRLPQVGPEDTLIRVELDPPRTIRWPLTDRDGPLPPDGARVTLRERVRGLGASRAPLPLHARVEGKELVGAGFAPGHIQALAVAPDGSIARLFCESETDVGNEASFRPAHTVTVHVSLPDGTPAQGLYATVRNQGNNPLHDPVPLDTNGIARIEGLYGRLAEVYLSEKYDDRGGLRVGSVNLEKGGGEFEFTVERQRSAVVQILIDGEPGVPPGGRLFSYGAGVITPDTNAERGELRFVWRPHKAGGKVAIMFTAPGVTQAQGEIVAGEGPGPDRATLRVERAGTLVVRLRLPADKLASPVVQVWNATSNSWGRAPVLAPHGGGIDPSGVIRFAPLVSGRYRVIEAGTGLASSAVDLVAGASPAELIFDVSTMGYVQGRVEVPDGVDPSAVRVELIEVSTGKPLSNPHGWKRGQVSPNGEFWVRVPGNKEVLLRPVHAFLRRAGEGGRVRVTKPRKGIVLKMIRGPTASLRFDPKPELPRHRREDAKLRVLLFKDVVAGEPLRSVDAPLRDDTIQFGGFEPGTYTLWIDVPGAAPVIVKGATLGDGETDLGTTKTSPGTTVRLRILVKEGEAVPRLGVSAHSADEPKYFRWINTRGESVVELKGLGPGEFRFQVTAQMGSLPKRVDQTIKADGSGVIEQTLDLR